MTKYFGIFESYSDFVQEGQEGLRINPITKEKVDDPIYVEPRAYQVDFLNNSGYAFYEIEKGKSAKEQLDLKNITRYVNQKALQEYQELTEDLLQKIDLGGVLEKDRLKPTEDPSGTFDFSLAAPTLYRMVEWYVEELDELVDGNFVEKIELGKGQSNFYTYIDGKQYRVRRQQTGTFEILKNVPNAKLILVSDNMYATSPVSGKGIDGKTYRLKFATKTKKIYLIRPKKGGAPQYLDVFAPINASSSLNSQGMLAKITPIMMFAEQMEQAGVKVRIYGTRLYKEGKNEILMSWVLKEYGAPLDIDAIAIASADPRFFRYGLWQNTEGVIRKMYDKEIKGYGLPFNEKSEMNLLFNQYRNYLWDLKNKGLFQTKVNDKSLMIIGGLSNPSNNFKSNEKAIEDEFYRIGDLGEMLLAKDIEKAIRRIVDRERAKGTKEWALRSKLIDSINNAFVIVTDATPKIYNTPASEIPKIDERRDKIIDAINRVLG